MKRIGMEEYTERYQDLTDFAKGELRMSEAEREDFPMPGREARSHKYRYGRALVIAGCRGYSGAPVLAANACERSGAGLTHLMVPESIYPIAAARCDGAVVTPLPAAEAGGFALAAEKEMLTALKKADACVIGPGLGTSKETAKLTESILRETECPLVLDADALTACVGKTELLVNCRAPLILTPHEGEFRRLGGDLNRGRLAAAQDFVDRFPKLILILKGYGTLVCRTGELSVNPSGGPGMAKGGSGDVLCGILCALLAQGMEPWFAARCAVYLHGAAGDLAAAELGEYSLAPSDLIRHLPQAFRGLPRAE